MARFNTLRLHGTKVYKFTQGKSIFTFLGEAVYPSIRTGVCAALTADWLSEKLTRPWTLRFSGDFSGGTVHAFKNRDIVEQNSQTQISYRALGPQGGEAWLLTHAGLRDFLLQVPVFGHGISFGQTLDRIAQLVPQGRGAYLSMTAGGHGHAMGLYRSRGDHLYFFDANCGVYQVPNANSTVAAFFTELATCYANFQHPLDYKHTTFVRI